MKIALIAMSGIRVCDEELLRKGLTLPGFVERSRTIASLPSLGLLTLAGMMPKGWELEYLEIDDRKKLGELPRNFDVAAISTYSAQVLEAYDLAAEYEAIGIPVIMGGPHVSALPEEAAKYCSSVVVGEGECVWAELLRDLQCNSLKKIYRSNPPGFNLEEAPMPAFELLDIQNYNRLTVQASRGCPHLCHFCASSVLISSSYKQKPAAKVLGEIDKILDIWNKPFIEFADDNIFVNKAYWRAILPEIQRRNIRWFAETDMSVAEDRELLGLLSDSGCAQLLIGFESPSPVSLQGVETKSNWKYKRFPQIKEAIKTIQSYGISVNGCFVTGMDGQGPEVFDDIVDFVEESGLFEVQITIQTPFPGTPLYGELKKENRLLYEGEWQRCTLFDVSFHPKNMTTQQLHDGFHRIAGILYGDELTARRKDRFRRCLRELRRIEK